MCNKFFNFQIDLSATCETDPFKPITITPIKGKRSAAETSHDNNVDPSPPQHSSTRLRSKIKIEKNP
jgi:hypothetical protein